MYIYICIYIWRFPKIGLLYSVASSIHRFSHSNHPAGDPHNVRQVGALTFEGRRVETALYHRECVAWLLRWDWLREDLEKKHSEWVLIFLDDLLGFPQTFTGG